MEMGVLNIKLIIKSKETGEESQFNTENIETVNLQPIQAKKHIRYKNFNNVSIKLKESKGLDYLRELARKERIVTCIKTVLQYFVEAGSIKEIFKPKHLYVKVGRGNQK